MKNLFLIDGASGTGKTDMLKWIYSNENNVALVMKYTTREHRDYEKEENLPLDLTFISEDNFSKMKFKYSYKYSGRNYGFSKKELDEKLRQYDNVFIIIRNCDKIRELMNDYSYINVVPVYIYTDRNKLRERLKKQQKNEKQIKSRIDRLTIAYRNYKENPELYKEIVINNSSIEDYYTIIRKTLINKYISSPVIDDKLIFVLMSFNPDNPMLEDYFKAMQRAVNKLEIDLKCINLEDIDATIKISDEAKMQISNCRLAIVDLTERKHNVFYELGFAHGSGKKCIITAIEGTELPLYAREYKVILYKSATDLEEQLESRLRYMLGIQNNGTAHSNQ